MKYAHFFFLFTLLSYSQQTQIDKEIDELIDDLFFNDNAIENLVNVTLIKDFIYINLNYNSNTFYAGRKADFDQYNFTSQITYFNKRGWYVNISGIYLSELEPKWDLTSLAGGYSRKLGKKGNFAWNTSFSKYFFTVDSGDIFSNRISSGFSYYSDNGILFLNSGGSYFFGGSNLFQIQANLIYNISLYSVANPANRSTANNDIIMLSDNFNIAKSKSNNQRTVIEFSPSLVLFVNSEKISTDTNSLLFNRNYSLLSEQTYFGLINTQLQLPVNLNWKYFDIEISYNLNFPKSVFTVVDPKVTSFFGFSLGYFF